jgi:hypothetical protein
VWTIGSQTIGQPEQGEIMRAVEHGGLHSRVRAIGVSRYCDVSIMHSARCLTVGLGLENVRPSI